MRTIITGFILLCSLVAPAVGQPCLGLRAVGNLIEIAPELAANRGSLAVAFSVTSQRYLVVYLESSDQTAGNDLFCQMIGADGGLIGGRSPLIQDPGSQSSETIAWNSDNDEFLVAWESQVPGDFRSDARRVGIDGAPLAAPFEIASGGDELSLAFGASTYLFTRRSGGIDGLLLSAAAIANGPDFDISGLGLAAPNGNTVFDPLNGRFLSIWRDQGQSQRNIQARIVRPDGSFATDPFIAVNEFPGTFKAAFDEELRRYFIVFTDAGTGQRLRGRFMDENGGLSDEPFELLEEEINFFDLVYNPVADAFVIVADVQRGSRQRDVLAFSVRSDGVVGRDRVVLASGNATFPAIALNPVTGECLAVWSDTSRGVDNTLIRGRRLAFGEPFCSAFPGCGAGLCGIGICGGGFAPMMPVTLAAMVWMKRRRGWKVRAIL